MFNRSSVVSIAFICEAKAWIHVLAFVQLLYHFIIIVLLILTERQQPVQKSWATVGSHAVIYINQFLRHTSVSPVNTRLFGNVFV